VPFGGIYRLVDFVLSNLVNSGVQKIYVLTQYKAQSLLRHLQMGWVGSYSLSGHFILPVPAQMRVGEFWYQGTADAIRQNIYLIEQIKPDLVLVFGSDHVYYMDVSQMVRYHLEKGAEVTVSTIPFPITECHQFGTVIIDRDWRIREFQEKVPNPVSIPNQPDVGLVSMGNYVFNTDLLVKELEIDTEDPQSRHDFGGDILPRICKNRYVYAYDFFRNEIPGLEGPHRYWRDVGTLKSYYDAQMDLKNPLPSLNLYNTRWPVRSEPHMGAAAKVVVDMHGKAGVVNNCLIGPGSVVSGAYVRDSIIGKNVFVGSGAHIEESILLGHTVVGEGARIRRAIIEHGNVIDRGDTIGYDLGRDMDRFFVDESGIVATRWRQYDVEYLFGAAD